MIDKCWLCGKDGCDTTVHELGEFLPVPRGAHKACIAGIAHDPKWKMFGGYQQPQTGEKQPPTAE